MQYIATKQPNLATNYKTQLRFQSKSYSSRKKNQQKCHNT